MKRLMIAGTAVACALTLAGCSDSGNRAAPGAGGSVIAPDLHTISTRGNGKISVTPDTMTITLGVETRDPSAKVALGKNNDRTNALLKVLKANGVADKDLQTVDLGINPTWDDHGNRITGYQVTNTVRATFHDIRKAGGVIDAAAAAVGDDVRLNGVVFSLGDDTVARATARAKAVTQARAQAEQIAKAAGVELARVRTITEAPPQSTQYPQPAYYAADKLAASVPIQSGQLDLSVEVEITYDIA